MATESAVRWSAASPYTADGWPCSSRRTHGGVARAMKRTVGGGGGDGERKSLRNRRRRCLDDDRPLPPPPSPPQPARSTPPLPSATVTSGALHRLQTSADGCGRDPAAAVAAAATADDWLFADWLDGGGTGASTAATSTYLLVLLVHRYNDCNKTCVSLLFTLPA